MASSPSIATMGISNLPLSNPTVVGSLWMISSSVFSTYYTTAFLKTGERWETDKGKIKGLIHRSKDLLISRSTLPEMLTLYRLGGSILLGHMISPDLFQLGNRINTTFNSMKVFTLPGIFLLSFQPDSFQPRIILESFLIDFPFKIFSFLFLIMNTPAPAFFLFVANYCNSVALKRIGIPLLYTSKCGIPFFVVLATLFIDGAEALPPPLALMSLLRKCIDNFSFFLHVYLISQN